MKKQKWKLVLTIICVLAAGICYSCSGHFPVQPVSKDNSEILYLETDVRESRESNNASTEAAYEVRLTQKTEDGYGAGTHKGVEDIPETGACCYVHICGAVVNPGVYELKPGERVFQAVEYAGGFTEEAAEEYLNLALEVEDGMKIVVPSKTEAEAWPTVAEEAQGKVNLNTATKAELMTLSGIGEARAEDIIRYRETKGLFSRIEDIKKVSGIKDAAFQKIKDDITV